MFFQNSMYSLLFLVYVTVTVLSLSDKHMQHYEHFQIIKVQYALLTLNNFLSIQISN